MCDVTKQNVNNWVWTPFIERGLANLIYIEVKFTIRDCSLFPGYALSCKETFSLLYYEFDVATREPPPWEPDSYKSVGKCIGTFNDFFLTQPRIEISIKVCNPFDFRVVWQ